MRKILPHFCYIIIQKEHLSTRNVLKTGVAGFEPTHDGVKVRCLTAWLYPKKKMEESGFEPLNPKERLQSVAFSHFAIPPKVIVAVTT